MNYELKKRFYTKKELALLYFPESGPKRAVNHLMSWIRRNTRLWELLQQTGYDNNCKTFTPRQVKTIVEELGEP